MPTDEVFQPSDDAPKENPWTDDKLGFKPFAERLSKVLLKLEAPNGYVIGLHGEWGSGKSTALNFVKAFLEKHNAEVEGDSGQIEVIDFRPWIVSGHQDLITSFFKVLSERLPGAERSGWVNRNLRRIRGATDPVIDAVATLAIVADPTMGIASKATGKVVSTSLNHAIDRFLEEPSLQAAYDKLHALLATKKKRFLVIIDDIDRLRRDEIRLIMQMVKTVGRLPNVVYLLSYDRDIVWDALDDGVAAKRIGPNFGEKIVQQEVELPRPFQDDLLSALDTEIGFVTADSPNNARWLYLVRDGIRRWIRQPRDVQRLANAVKFSWPALKGEVDPQDLLIMEALRLFDERVFDWIRWNRDFLFSEGRFLMADDGFRKKALEQFENQISSEGRDQTLEILSALFPTRRTTFRNNLGSDESYADVVRRRGIGCEAGYDAYFTLFPSPNEVPSHAIGQFLDKLNDRAALIELVLSYFEKMDRTGATMVGRLFQELSFRFSGPNSPTPTQPLLDAMFDIGETIMEIDWQMGTFRASPRMLWGDLVRNVLLSWNDPDAAGEHLDQTFRETESTALCATVLVGQLRELGEIRGGSGGRSAVTIAVAKSLGKTLLSKIEADAEDDSLSNYPRLWDVMRVWKYMGGAADAKAWLAKNMSDSAQVLSSITESFVSYVVGSEPRDYSMSEAPDPELYDLSALLEATRKHMQGDQLTDDARLRIGVVEQYLVATIKQNSIKESEQVT
jgi:predicted KAP-like P-loop ATPase